MHKGGVFVFTLYILTVGTENKDAINEPTRHLQTVTSISRKMKSHNVLGTGRSYMWQVLGQGALVFS
jgi:hypothetical protein